MWQLVLVLLAISAVIYLVLAVLGGRAAGRYRRTLINRRHPIITSALAGDLKAVKDQLDTGVAADTRDGIGEQAPRTSEQARLASELPVRTALMIALGSGRIDIASLLIAAGADVNFHVGDGNTPLGYAIGGGDLEAVKFILSHGADPRINTGLGSTPLNDAADIGDAEIVEELISAGCAVNDQSGDGDTPLITAAWCDHPNPRIVQLLLDAGGDLTIRNKEGKSAIDLARDRGLMELCAMMEQHGCS